MNSDGKKKTWSFLSNLPAKSERYIVLDTETTGINFRQNNVIELAAVEVKNGKLTGLQFHGYLKPRYFIHPKAQEKHKLSNSFFKEFFEDVYESDRRTMQNFLLFVGDSLIFAHNAMFDCNFINNELSYWNLPIINKERYRCTMKLYVNKLSRISASYRNSCSLQKCCESLKIKANNGMFHTAIFDAFMAGRLLCKIYEVLERNKLPGLDQNIVGNRYQRIDNSYLNNNLQNKDVNLQSDLNNSKDDNYKFLTLKNGFVDDEDSTYDDNLVEECLYVDDSKLKNIISLNSKLCENKANNFYKCDREVEDQFILEENQDFIQSFMDDQKERDCLSYLDKNVLKHNVNNFENNCYPHTTYNDNNFQNEGNQYFNNTSRGNKQYQNNITNNKENNFNFNLNRAHTECNNTSVQKLYDPYNQINSFSKSIGRIDRDSRENYLDIDAFELDKIIQENS